MQKFLIGIKIITPHTGEKTEKVFKIMDGAR